MQKFLLQLFETGHVDLHCKLGVQFVNSVIKQKITQIVLLIILRHYPKIGTICFSFIIEYIQVLLLEPAILCEFVLNDGLGLYNVDFEFFQPLAPIEDVLGVYLLFVEKLRSTDSEQLLQFFFVFSRQFSVLRCI